MAQSVSRSAVSFGRGLRAGRSLPAPRRRRKWRGCSRRWICCSCRRCATRCSRCRTSPAIRRSRCAPASSRSPKRAATGRPIRTNPLPKFSPPRRVPHGVTLLGRLFDEGTVARAGLALERAFGVAERAAGGILIASSWRSSSREIRGTRTRQLCQNRRCRTESTVHAEPAHDPAVRAVSTCT